MGLYCISVGHTAASGRSICCCGAALGGTTETQARHSCVGHAKKPEADRRKQVRQVVGIGLLLPLLRNTFAVRPIGRPRVGERSPQVLLSLARRCIVRQTINDKAAIRWS